MALLHLLVYCGGRKWRGVPMGTNGIAAFIDVTVVQEVERCAYGH